MTTVFGLAHRLTFGKYKGKTVQEVIDQNPRYLDWCLETIEWFDLSAEAREALEDSLVWSEPDDDWTWSEGWSRATGLGGDD